MTVKELIELLQKQNPDIRVVKQLNFGYDDINHIEAVKISSNFDSSFNEDAVVIE